MSLCLLNGEFVEASSASVPTSDRGFLLGDGVFETMRAYGGRVFRFADHFSRLSRSLETFNIQAPWHGQEAEELAQSLLEKNNLEDARLRLTVTRGPHTGSMGLAESKKPLWLLTAAPIPEYLASGERLGVKLATATVRFSAANPIFRHKTLNRLPYLFARAEAEKQGADEALILDETGNVACASTGNLFVLQNSQLFTPPLQGQILPGVTRKVVIEIARSIGVPLREDFFSPILLHGADEAFLTNSVQEIVPLLELDRKPIGSGRSGSLTSRLQALYSEHTQAG